ncbi:MAG: DNA repair protein RecN, partial [Terriglobales bacterium]
MLDTLQIENYALVEQVSIPFGPGFNVLTGETGSGKSIIVDALGLLLGERADSGAIRSGAASASVTGCFSSPFADAGAAARWASERGLRPLDGSVLLRRELSAGGRSRAFVEQQLATLAVLRELARQLGEIHSQNEALVSFSPAAQLRLLDRFAGAEDVAAEAAAAHTAWREATVALEREQAAQRRRLQDLDLWRFQADEIDAVRPLEGEDAALEQERTVLANTERILTAAEAAYASLYDAPGAAAAQVKAAQRQVQDWARFDVAAEALAPRLESLRAEIADIAGEIRARADRIEAAPGRLAQVEDRLAALDRLKRKYGPGLDGMRQHRDQLAADLAAAESATELEAAAAARTAAAATAYRQLAAALSERRRTAARQLERRLVAEVADLAMALRFEVAFEPAPDAPPEPQWTTSGWDRIRFLASTNPGEPLQPVESIASGGELSRLLLALHLVTEAAARPQRHPRRSRRTLVLDEIDAGIGGQAAQSVGQKLRQLGEHYQVLCVTHLPQIATCAAHHLRVEKREHGGRTRT